MSSGQSLRPSGVPVRIDVIDYPLGAFIVRKDGLYGGTVYASAGCERAAGCGLSNRLTDTLELITDSDASTAF